MDTLTAYMPPWVDESVFEKARKNSQFKGISLFGFLGTMTYVGAEYQAVGTLRAGFRGKRSITIANFDDLWRFLPDDVLSQKKGNWSEAYTIINFMAEVLSSKNDIVKSMLQKDGLFETAIVDEGDVIYIPSGVLVVERVLDGSPCTGLRLSVPDTESKSAKANVCRLIKEHQARISNPDASQLLSLWKFLRDLPEAEESDK